MADIQPTAVKPFFNPLPEHDSLNVAYFLWKIAEKITPAPGGCWLWTGSRNRDGYGTTGLGSRSELVHRMVYRLCVAPITDGFEVCHNCPGGDKPACCNPEHLFLGTHTDNMRDASRKGRLRPRDSRGVKNPFARLDDEKVRAIRARWLELAEMKGRAAIVAKEQGTSAATVYRIIKGLIWSHVQ